MKNKVKLFKYIFFLFCVTSCLIGIGIGLCKWIVSTSIKTKPIEITDIVDPDLDGYLSEIIYDAQYHTPHETINEFDSSKFKISYYDSNDNFIGSGNLSLGLKNAGFYKVKYENKQSLLITVIGFTIKRVPSTISIDPMYYSPYEDDYILQATDINGNSVQGTWTKTLALHTSDYTNSSETQDSHTIELTYSFTPNDTNYDSYENKVIEVKLFSVASIGSKFFSRVENALANASSGNTVHIVFGSSPIIYGNFDESGNSTVTIPSGVTLYLNYDANKTSCKETASIHSNGRDLYTSDSGTSVGVTNYSDKAANPNYITLNENVSLINNGTLIVGGTLSSAPCGPRNGHTSTNYSILIMKKNSKIESYGPIQCYGFIWEACSTTCTNKPYTKNTCTNKDCMNNGSQVIMHSNDLKIPFIIKDMGDGSAMAAFNNAVKENINCPAFNQFCFDNISSLLTMEYNSTITGIFNLYSPYVSTMIASLAAQSKTTHLLSNNSDSLIQLKNANSKFCFKYDSVTEKMKFEFYGDVAINALIIEVSINLVLAQLNLAINTALSLFPLSWQFDVYFHAIGDSSTVDCKQQLKLMPGSTLIIDENVNFIGSNIIIYEEYTDVTAFARTDYPKVDAQGNPLKPGLLAVGGKMMVDSIGGKVYSISPSATLTPKANASMSTKEAISNNGSTDVDEAKMIDWHEITIPLSINTNKGSMSSLSKYVSTENIYNQNIYERDELVFYYWTYLRDYTITFIWNIPNVDNSTYMISNIPQTNNGNVIFETEFLPEMKNYVGHDFSYWYINDSNNNVYTSLENGGLIGYNFNDNITVYAKWATINYNITYNHVYFENSIVVPDAFNNISVNNPESTYNKDSEFNLNEKVPTIETPNVNYKFIGWYYDAGCTIPLNNLNNYAEDITIYGKWEPANAKTYTIYYTIKESGSNNVNYSSIVSNINDVNNLTGLNIISEYNTDRKYIFGWYTDQEMNNQVTGNTDSDILTIVIEQAKNAFASGETEYNIYISVKNKYFIRYIDNGNSTTEYYKQNEEITLMKKTSENGYLMRWCTGNKALIPNTKYTLSDNLEVSLKKFYKITLTISNATIKLTANNCILKNNTTTDLVGEHSATSNGSVYIENNVQVTVNITYSLTSNQSSSIKKDSDGTSVTSPFLLNNDTYTITASSKKDSICVTADTLITLYDGSTIRVDQLTGNELVLTWNHESGRFEGKPISMLVQHDKNNIVQIVAKLNFSNNNYIKIIGAHVFYDSTLNKYVTIDYNNYYEYIGHEFIYFDGNSMTPIILESVDIYKESTQAWTLMTENNITCFANGFLQSIIFSDGILNAFEINPETLQYVNMKEDIEKYGLYTYDEFEQYISLYEYNMMKVYYFKISVEKGIVTFEEILMIFDELRKVQDDIYYPE